MNKTIYFVSIFVGLLFFTACHSKHHEEEKEETVFLVTSPYVGDTIISREYVCQIHATKHIELRALEEGYLEKVFVDEGQFVKQGQKMFQIMPNVYQADLQKAMAEANAAEIEFLNTKMLADSNIVSKNELALMKAKYDKALAEVQLAKTHLGFTDIRAPFDGIMDHLEAREGSLLDNGDLLTVLSDNSKMWVYYNVPEAEYLNYMMSKNKDKMNLVKLKMANNQIFNQIGTVETIEGEFDNETGNIAFRATFPNPDKILRHGETGNIIMEVPHKDAVIIPQSSTFEIMDRKYVYVIDENHVVHQRAITIAEELPHLYLISEGLKGNEKVLFEGIRKVQDGDKIEFDFKEPSEVINNLELFAE